MCGKILDKLTLLREEKINIIIKEEELNLTKPTKKSGKQTDIVVKRDENLKSPIEGILVSRYVIDFGHLVVGSSKKKPFKLCNTGQTPITFNLDKK